MKTILKTLPSVLFAAVVVAICLSGVRWLTELYIHLAWVMFTLLFIWALLGDAQIVKDRCAQLLAARRADASALQSPGLLSQLVSMLTLAMLVGATAYAGFPALACLIFVTVLAARGIHAKALAQAQRIDRAAEQAAAYEDATQTPV